MPERRWETDAVGHGIGDGSAAVAGVQRFMEVLTTPQWVAEHPEHHLLPPLIEACQGPDTPWQLVDATLDTLAVYQVALVWRRDGNLRQLRADFFTLLGAIAESATYVHQEIRADAVIYDVVTGMLEGDSPFKPHGHLARFTVHRGERGRQ